MSLVGRLFFLADFCFLPFASSQYTLFAGLLTLSSASFIMLSFKGEAWRKNNPWAPNKDKS